MGHPAPETRRGRQWGWSSTGGAWLVMRGPKRGQFHCFSGGPDGSPLDFIMFARSCDLVLAIAWAKSWLGIADGPALPIDDDALRQRAEERQRRRIVAEVEAEADERRRIAHAQRLWSESTPVSGTVAEAYLIKARAIPAPAAGWPDAVRFHPGSNALIVAATAVDGAVHAVQRVFLTPDAKKIDAAEVNARGLQNVKQTNGVRDGTVVRLPGPADGPLQLCEGPEGGLSAWSATGHETWICLGGFVTPPAGRVVITCRDDDRTDRHGKTSETKLTADMERWSGCGADLRIAWPWPERRRDGSDLNNVLQTGGVQAVRARIDAALATGPTPQTPPAATPAPHYPRPTLTGDVAGRRLRKVVSAMLDRVERRLEARDWIEAEADRLLPEATAESAARITARLIRNGMDPADAEEVAASRAAKVAPTLARRRARHAAVPAFGRRAVFGKPPRIQIKGSASLGKTRAIIEEYADRPSLWDRNIAIYVPLIVLSEQFATDAREAVAKAAKATNGTRGRVLVIRGREHVAADGSTLCHPERLPVIAAATRAGCGSVHHACCRTPANGEHAETTCPHYAWCAAAGYIAQFDDAPALRLSAHQHLALPQPKDLRLPTPDLAVVDESALGALIFHKEIDPAWLTDPATYSAPDDELRAVAIDIGRAVVAAFTGTGPALEAMRTAGITPVDLREAAGCADATHEEPKVVAGMSATEALKRFNGHRPSHGRPVAGVLRQLARDLEHGRATSLAIELDEAHTVSTDTGTRMQHPIFRRHGIHEVLVPQSAALLLLDADAIFDANKATFGADLRSFTIAAARVACVTQVYDTTNATSTLAPDERLPNNRAKAAKLRGRIEAFVDRLVGEDKRVLEVACLPVRKAFTGEKTVKLPAYVACRGAEFAHHGTILGSNRWTDFDAAVVIGREQMPPLAAERDARAIYGNTADTHLTLTGEYTIELRHHDLRQGTARPVTVQVHVDPLVQELVELKRERAMGQAIDRLRLIHRPADAPGEVYVMSNVPVPGLVVDRLVRLDDLLAGGTPLERAMARTAEGVLPLTPAWLHEKMADLFTSERTAKREIAADTGHPAIYILIAGWPIIGWPDSVGGTLWHWSASAPPAPAARCSARLACR